MNGREWRSKVTELADEMGWEVSKSKGGHLRLQRPGCSPVFTSASSSDWRALKNLRSQLRRSMR